MDLLESLVQADIRAGFQLPIPVKIICSIPNTVVAPYGIANQFSINEIGERIEKDRLIHDQSFDFSDGNLVNHRLIVEDEFHKLHYGSCLLQIMHYTHALRFLDPSKRIVWSKFDFKIAHRRQHLMGRLAAIATTIVGAFALISLRLPFSGTYYVHAWCVISELICDATNALLRCSFWDPAATDFPLKSDIPEPKLLSDEVETGVAFAPDVLVDPDPRGKVFCYIDDLTVLGYYDEGWKRLKLAAALIISVFGRPVHESEPVPRMPLLSVKKLLAEGGLGEIKVMLGWLLDFRAQMVKLPDDKYKMYNSQINVIIKRKQSTMKELDSLVSRFGYSCIVQQMGYHFLHRLRYKIDRSTNGNCTVNYTQRDIADLIIWKRLLSKANKGVSFNLIVYCRPTKMYLSDACPYGMGGFSLLLGRAWYMQLPIELAGKVSNNLFEYLAQIICIWIDVLIGAIKPHDCYLSAGDNTVTSHKILWTR